MSDSALDLEPVEAEAVLYSLDDSGVAWVSLNRPHRLNAINSSLIAGLVSSLARAGSEGAGVVVLQGNGRAFCSGHDLQEDELSGVRAEQIAQGLQEVTRRMRAFPGPVVSAVHGYALGGGFEFALASDLVVAARSARFGFPEVAVGLTVTGGVTKLLPQLVGPMRAKRLLLLGEMINAEEAYSLGLLTSVCESEELEERCELLAKELAAKPRSSMALTKQALDAGPDNFLEDQLELEVEHLLRAAKSSDASMARDKFRGR